MNHLKLFFQEKRWKKDDRIAVALGFGGTFFIFAILEILLTIQQYQAGEKDYVLYGIMSFIWLGATLAFLIFAFNPSIGKEEKEKEKN